MFKNILKILKFHQYSKKVGFYKLKENIHLIKVQNAVNMIHKMSNLSRGFIVANSLCKIILKNQ